MQNVEDTHDRPMNWSLLPSFGEETIDQVEAPAAPAVFG